MPPTVVCFDSTERDRVVALHVDSWQMLKLMYNIDGLQRTGCVAGRETVDV